MAPRILHSKADLDEPSTSLDSRCGARWWAASRCSLRKIPSEGFGGIMCFPTAGICDVAWVAGPHRDASPVLGPHRGCWIRWFIEFFLSRSHTSYNSTTSAAAARRLCVCVHTHISSVHSSTIVLNLVSTWHKGTKALYHAHPSPGTMYAIDERNVLEFLYTFALNPASRRRPDREMFRS